MRSGPGPPGPAAARACCRDGRGCFVRLPVPAAQLRATTSDLPSHPSTMLQRAHMLPLRSIVRSAVRAPVARGLGTIARLAQQDDKRALHDAVLAADLPALRSALSELQTHGIQPLPMVYEACLMRVAEESGSFEDASGIVSEMLSRGIPLTFVSYNQLLKVCEQQGRADMAMSVMKEMKANTDILGRPNKESFTYATRTCARAGHHAYAYGLIMDQLERHILPTPSSFYETLKALRAAGDTAKAEKLKSLMRAHEYPYADEA